MGNDVVPSGSNEDAIALAYIEEALANCPEPLIKNVDSYKSLV